MTLAGCGVSMGGDTPLATVKIASEQTAEITQTDVTEVIDDIVGSERFLEAIYGGSLPEGTEQVILTQMIRVDVLRSEAEALGVSPSPEDTANAEAELESQLAQAMSAVDPVDPAGAAAEVRGEIGAYFDLIADSLATNSALETAYAAETEGGNPCAVHILVGLEDEELALDLLAQLEGGADFATLAQENSIDPGSAALGGELGCTNPQSYVPEFRDAVIAAELGELVGPIQTDYGYHIIEVTGYENPEEVAARFASVFDDVEVSIDPDFGTWDTAGQQVTPPTSS